MYQGVTICLCIYECMYVVCMHVFMYVLISGVGSISCLVRRGRGRATTCELYAKIIAEPELLQPALNEIRKFCFQHWSRGCGTCGTGSGVPAYVCMHACMHVCNVTLHTYQPYHLIIYVAFFRIVLCWCSASRHWKLTVASTGISMYVQVELASGPQTYMNA